MPYLVLLTLATYFYSFFLKFISDDITINSQLKSKNYPLLTEKTFDVFTHFFDCVKWKLLKENKFLHHLVSFVLFSVLSCSFYIVAKKYIPEPVAFLAAMIFIVHPANTQTAAWISSKWWSVSAIIALWALYFDDALIYVFSALFAYSTAPFIILIKCHWIVKVFAIILVFYLYKRDFKGKVDMARWEGEFKSENLKVYPRKVIVAIKSFCYYFTIALFPVKTGWFHELGEPVDEGIKSIDFHFFLCVLLFGTLALFYGTPAFLGIFLFVLFIAPFSNFITLALFTSERYMTPAIMGWSIFVAYLTINHPIVSAVIITAYFMRTQLVLWSFKDDFHLALSSLLNFDKSGYAWTNFANILLATGKPSAAFDILREIEKRLPTFPTTYWLLYVMYRSTDILNDFDQAVINLEKACRHGKHQHWIKELEDFKKILKQDRVVKFKNKYVTGNPVFEQLRTPAQPPA